MLVLSYASCTEVVYAQETVIIKVDDFGKGMTPVLPAWRNDPSAITFSQNMYSTQPGGRQLRFGYTRIDTIAPTDSAIRSLEMFLPSNDSGHIVFAADGYWFGNVAGHPSFDVGQVQRGFDWITFNHAARQITPYFGGDSIALDGDSVIGFGSRFIRDLQPGDTIHAAESVKVIDYIVSDNKLMTTGDWTTSNEDSFLISRTYSKAYTPFLHQSGDYMYTGTSVDPPQIIYTKDDTLRIRPMGIVDSFYVDSIYSLYPPRTGVDSTEKYGARRSWDTTSGGARFIKEIQVITRRKAGQWSNDNWLEDLSANPQAYYVRLGVEDRTSFFPISGNTDTSLYLMTWYADSGAVDSALPVDTLRDTTETTGGGYVYLGYSSWFTMDGLTDEPSKYWDAAKCSVITGTYAGSTLTITHFDSATSLFLFDSPNLPGWDLGSGETVQLTRTPDSSWLPERYFNNGQTLNDTIATADIEGTWGYIYSAAGFYDVVVPDGSTGAGFMRGRGALFYTIDGSFPIDTTEFYKAMHFIHLTGDDIDFAAFADSSEHVLRTYLRYHKADNPLDTLTLHTLDNIQSQKSVWRCRRVLGTWPRRAKYFTSYEQAATDCPINSVIDEYIEYVIATTRTDVQTKEATAIGNSYFPIRFAANSVAGDTIFFITAIGTDLTDLSTVSTSNWEIVKIGMPNFSGMTEWNTPPQLVGWGDTASVSLLSFSGVNDPWNWSVTNDILVGNDPAAPIVSVFGYDDQLVIFKPSSILGFDGARFKELSQTDGLVAPRAVVGLTKELYWLDVDGVKKMARRDFSGYSIQKVSTAIDPILNSWSATNFSYDVVPVSLSTEYRGNAVMTYNQRDRHLYLFGTFSGTTNNACLTYGVETGLWDGYFTIPATDAVWATIRDTSRILIGGAGIVYAMDYVFRDVNVGIDADIRSAKFMIEDKGWPVKSRLKSVWFNGRGFAGGFDEAYILLIGENARDSFNLSFKNTLSGTSGDIGQTFHSSQDNLSRYWQWQIKTEGNDSASLFQPHELRMEFIPVAREH